MDKLYPAPLVFIHPIDAEGRRIRQDDVVTVQSPRGMIQAKAKFTEDVGPGLVAIDVGWGNPSDKRSNLNALTADDAWDPISGGYPDRLFLCKMKRLFEETSPKER